MSKSLVKRETGVAKRESVLDNFTPEELELIRETVAKGASDVELRFFLYTANLRGLNPLTRQIHFVKRKSRQSDGSMKDTFTIQTGIDGFRLIAQRTKQYAPGSKPTIFEYKGAQLVRATVFGIKLMNGQGFEFSASANFKEFAQSFNGRLGTMWAKMPESQLEKCAEAKMLRRGWPEDFSNLYADEEMEQADNTIETIHPAELPITTPAQSEEGSEPAVDSLNPYTHYLLECPEHGDLWAISRSYGKRCHKVGEAWCNFREQIKPILKQRCELAGLDGYAMNDLCKENFGTTWSKLTEDQQIDILWAIDELDKEGNEPSGANPLVEEAKKFGGVASEPVLGTEGEVVYSPGMEIETEKGIETEKEGEDA